MIYTIQNHIVYFEDIYFHCLAISFKYFMQLCYIPNFKELCTAVDGLFKNMQESLSTCMTIEGLMSEHFDGQKVADKIFDTFYYISESV